MNIAHSKIKSIQKLLIGWYRNNKRSMPWRDTRDAYKIWISEIMLQQTQVATVHDYYARFIRQLPTVADLAEASRADVMKLWEGLGYYGRARNMHDAAKQIMVRFNGIFPDTFEDLLHLPGIGQYTAGAILSIAFDQPVPVVDGNVMRVLTRLFHITDNISRMKSRTRLWDIANALLPPEHPGDFNQALMELGALVCVPRVPVCASCPLKSMCEANRLSLQNQLPVKSPRKPVPHYDVTAGIIWKNDHFLITLRPPKGLLGGLWEFPGGKKEKKENLRNCLKREIFEELQIKIAVGDHLVSIKHAYTHFRITLHVFNCTLLNGKVRCIACDDFRWITPAELDDYAFPAADRKVIEQLQMQKIPHAKK